MLNLLIIEDNLIESHFLVNSICKKVPNIRLYSVVSTGIEAIDILKEKEVDIIILDLKLPDMEGKDVIDFISKNNIIKYKSSVIAITEDIQLLTKIIGNEYIFTYCSKTNDINFIIEKINDLLNIKEKKNQTNIIKEQIKIELENLNFDFSYIGTKYIYECIYQCYCKRIIYDVNLNKEIYPIISKKYKKSINSIKANIFQTISIMYYKTGRQILSDYFGYTVINKPKNKEIIIAILKKL